MTTPGPESARARRWRRLGLGVTIAAIVLLGDLDLVQHYRLDPAAALALSALRAVPLVIYRREPLVAWLVALGATLVTAVVSIPTSAAEPWPWAVSSTGALVALSGLAAAAGERRLTLVMLGVLTTVGLAAAVVTAAGDWVSVLVTSTLCAVGVVVGDTVRARRDAVSQLSEERRVSAAERDRRRLVEERARIARELHDVVAHHMSVITVQAETARYRLDALPEPVAAEFADIARLARGSLTELRGLLSALRDETDGAALAPQPTLDGLPALVARVEATGTPVTLTVPAEVSEVSGLSRVVQLSAYRIVQEALSNVVRHAGGAPTTVTVACTESTLRVTVTNEAPPGGLAVAGGQGYGLVGLRERATLLGGTLEVDQPDGGWRVRAELPVGEKR